MSKLIQDCFVLDTLQVISEGNGANKPMKVKGVFGRADEFNNNNRRYPAKILEREVNRLQPLAESGKLVGELDHPDYTNVKLSNASHKVTKLSFKGGIVEGEADILNTPAGKVAQTLINDGVKLGISSRGVGTLTEVADSPGMSEVNEDYKCVSYDLVADPSTRGAYPELCEDTLQVAEKLGRTKKQMIAEDIFIKLLESKLNEMKLAPEEGSPALSKLMQKKTDKFGRKPRSSRKRKQRQAQQDRFEGKVKTVGRGDKLTRDKKSQPLKNMRPGEENYVDDSIQYVVAVLMENNLKSGVTDFVKKNSGSSAKKVYKSVTSGQRKAAREFGNFDDVQKANRGKKKVKGKKPKSRASWVDRTDVHDDGSESKSKVNHAGPKGKLPDSIQYAVAAIKEGSLSQKRAARRATAVSGKKGFDSPETTGAFQKKSNSMRSKVHKDFAKAETTRDSHSTLAAVRKERGRKDRHNWSRGRKKAKGIKSASSGSRARVEKKMKADGYKPRKQEMSGPKGQLPDSIQYVVAALKEGSLGHSRANRIYKSKDASQSEKDNSAHKFQVSREERRRAGKGTIGTRGTDKSKTRDAVKTLMRGKKSKGDAAQKRKDKVFSTVAKNVRKGSKVPNRQAGPKAPLPK